MYFKTGDNHHEKCDAGAHNQANTSVDVASLLDIAPFSLSQANKQVLFEDTMNALTRHHVQHCDDYRSMLEFIGYSTQHRYALHNLPPLPVRMFKLRELLSCRHEQVVKTLTSSGTSGQQVSRIFLDRDNARLQTQVLARILSEITKGVRLPMLIVDSPSVIRDRNLFSARGAGVLGFSMFGTDVTYMFDEHMKIDHEAVGAFCERHSDGPVLMFGFTSIVWEHLYKAMREKCAPLPLRDSTLLHGGGWKKLADQAVDPITFDASLPDVCGIGRSINYYGMVEQTGSIFLTCSHGYLHCSNFSDVIVRRPDFSQADFGESGALQLMSLLPTSYPGHNLLSEDEAVIHGEDDCACGRKGRYFHVAGRIRLAEIRGCSDTYRAA